MGESVTEGTIAKWLKQPGDQVREGEGLVEVTTDKVDAEVPAPASGTLVKILAEAGKTVAVGPHGSVTPSVTLRKLGVELPVVTLGEQGAAFLWQDRLVRVAAPSIPRVDSTGAGDAFTAGLLFGLTRLYADAAALRFAGVGELREIMTLAWSDLMPLQASSIPKRPVFTSTKFPCCSAAI